MKILIEEFGLLGGMPVMAAPDLAVVVRVHDGVAVLEFAHDDKVLVTRRCREGATVYKLTPIPSEPQRDPPERLPRLGGSWSLLP